MAARPRQYRGHFAEAGRADDRNEQLRRQRPEETAEGVKAIVEKLRTKLPNTKILVLAIFPQSADNNNPLRQVNAKVNEKISKLADDHRSNPLLKSGNVICRVADILPVFYGHGRGQDVLLRQ